MGLSSKYIYTELKKMILNSYATNSSDSSHLQEQTDQVKIQNRNAHAKSLKDKGVFGKPNTYYLII